MPSRSPSQKRLMQAAAHTPGGYGGVPQSVGEEFAAADKAQDGRSTRQQRHKKANKFDHYADSRK